MGSWIVFVRVNGVKVTGNGEIHGKGFEWWRCAVKSKCMRPMGMKFHSCNNIEISGLKIFNTPEKFLSVSDSNHVIISNLQIKNPKTSPNTDGMDLTHSTNVYVRDSHISTGDDCIAILSGCSRIFISGISCIQGHGISIGSMGHNGQYDTVEEVHVRNCKFGSSLNGAHIKTWQGGSGFVRKVTFQDITLHNTSNPINIDQFYCPGGKCPNQTRAVQLSDISFIGFRGTSFTETAINIACSQSLGCSNIFLDHINIISSDPHKKVHSNCFNARGRSTNTFPAEFLLILLVVALASWRPTTEASTADVMQHGAAGDGKTDDSKAFLKAWENICNGDDATAAILIIPAERTFLLKPVKFEGPCKSSTINVQALTFSACNNLQLSGLSHVNSQSAHIHITSSNSVLVSNLYIIAPASSPNTDGIDISHSTDAWIHDSTIGTGDDCIAIGGDSSNIKITGVTCGPGHGISIGSLGHNGNTDIVEEVHVKDCILKRTTNGVRIKTWQGGSGYARKISFENITLDAVANPIIIDQFYCDHKFKCKNQTSAVKVSNVIYKGVHGTSITEDSIKLMCSQSISCSDIVLSDINIVSANSGKPTHAFCSNAYGTNSLSNPLVNCLSIPLTYEGCHPPENCLPPSQSTKFLDFHNVYLFFLSFLLCFSFLNPL
ncbi:hypothetical protein MANES_04G114650v8 [Manihot esculenta]|uniref:Uncharacterized protein n=1 Tax=Manihot esculenta TaxID=3983 RepID=A0ACB7HTZ5_MANES|nr:hypothetical protein MANES_04G114650v8 [Manihot esculenta]